MSRAQRSTRSTLTRALALVPVSLLGMMGCSSLIGLDGYTVAKGGAGGELAGGAGGASGGLGGIGGHGGSAGRSGGAGSAGKSGSGGAVGSAGTGAAGEAGSGGTGAAGSGGTGVAGAMGEAGAGQAGAPPSQQPLGCDGKTSFVPNENVIRSCLLRAGCSPNTIPVRTISECVSKNTQLALPGESSCNLKTCADYEACEHIGVAHDDLCGGTLGTRCDSAGRAINCGNYLVDEFLDCPALGGTCATYTYTDADHTLYADCEISPPTDCTNVTDDSLYFCKAGTSSVPDSQYYCFDGQAYGSSCGQFATCSDGTCYLKLGTQCSGPDTAACDSGRAKVCSAGDVIVYDCGSVGLGCATKSGSTDGYCVAPGCTPAKVDNCVESCSDDGTTLTFCYGGVPYSVDCTAYGFTQCLSGTYGDNDDIPFAACR